MRVDADNDVEALRRERDQALAHARAMEHEVGALRGRVKRLEVIMWRRTRRRQQAAIWVSRARRLLRR
jgi:hypothetical protein